MRPLCLHGWQPQSTWLYLCTLRLTRGTGDVSGLRGTRVSLIATSLMQQGAPTLMSCWSRGVKSGWRNTSMWRCNYASRGWRVQAETPSPPPPVLTGPACSTIKMPSFCPVPAHWRQHEGPSTHSPVQIFFVFCFVLAIVVFAWFMTGRGGEGRGGGGGGTVRETITWRGFSLWQF